jgi:SAM-dependent methyltransferase
LSHLALADNSKEMLFQPSAWSETRRNLILLLLARFRAWEQLVDVGCGPHQPWAGYSTFGVDINPQAVSMAFSNGVKTIVSDITELPIRKNSSAPYWLWMCWRMSKMIWPHCWKSRGWPKRVDASLSQSLMWRVIGLVCIVKG